MPRRATHLMGILTLACLLASCSGKKDLSITGLAPNKGPYIGGDPVTITGSGFQTPGPKGFDVFFGKRKARNAVILSDEQIRVEPPGGEVGEKVDVVVQFDDARKAEMKEAYMYIDPAAEQIKFDTF